MVNNVMLEPKTLNGTVPRPSHEGRKMSSTRGIMTLTRSPCDLDTMSLFQDLKLKRRKVDSRCSSDGESVAETSTSSPDMAGPPSPCPKLHGEGRSSPSPEPDRLYEPNIIEKNSVGDIRDSQVKEEGDNCVFDGGGDSSDVTPPVDESIVKQESSNEDSEEPPGRNTAEDIKIKQEIIAQQEQRSQEEKKQQLEEERRLENEEIRRLQEERIREKREMAEKDEEKKRLEQVARMREQEEMRRQHQRMQDEMRIKQELERRNERGPVIETTDRQWHSPVSERWQSPPQSDRLKYPPINVERVIVERQRNSPPGVIERMRLSPEQKQHQLQQQRIRNSPEHRERQSPEQLRIRLSPEQPRIRLSPEQSRVRVSPEQQQRLSPLIQRSSPVIQRQPSLGEQGSPGGGGSVINMVPPASFWVNQNAGRINGVKPELIGGGNVNVGFPAMQMTDMKPPRPVATPMSPGARQTPTVIMGEAGGVRTMIWSHPNPSSPPNPPAQNTSASTSAINWSSSSQSNTGTSSNSSEESAAQLLLNLGQSDRQHSHYQPPLNMERLWAGDLSQLPPSQQNQALNLAMLPGAWPREMKPPGIMNMLGETRPDPDDDEQPMICMICEDKATGLHYGIITCEGCKGFFKRTVQNRRVYTCVADGNCEITKAQRNRCQYCRFKKCIEQGMVLQAVREDRMPGGRNSGAVYNLYKVKYKKHKKNPKNGIVKGGHIEKGNQLKSPVSPEQGIPSHIVNGTILKTALTNPSEVVHLRQRLDNTVSSSRDRTFPLDTILNMIQALIDCDEFQDIATLRNLEDLLDHKSDLSEKLCQIGDSIVYKLVQWTKRLPFYLELPVEVHTRLLTHKWHELLVLTTSAYQAIHGVHKLSSTSTAGQEADFTQEVSNNLVTLQTCLTSMMGRPITMDQLRQDVGLMVEKITHVTLMFRRVKLRMEEYVCLKVITMLNQARGGSAELEAIQDRYMTCLKSYVEHSFPQHPGRFHELLLRLPEIQSAAALLLESKMFYVPFLLNSAIQR